MRFSPEHPGGMPGGAQLSQRGFPSACRCWHMITSEYPPQTGGVSDYTHLMAGAFAALGDEVHVWCPSGGGEPPLVAGVTVHRRLGKLTPADLRKVSRELDQFSAPRRIVVQWVPHGYGFRSMNLPFCWWLRHRARHHGDQIELLVHEPYLSFRLGGLRQSAAALVHRAMVIVLLRAACRVWVTIPDWERRLRPYALGRHLDFQWLPIFSNVPAADDATQVQTIRRRYASDDQILLGHFGTFGGLITHLLEPILLALSRDSGRVVLLMGHGSERYRESLVRKEPRLAGVIYATGKLPAEQLSYHLSACDIMIQPYPDGVSSRRGSFMAGLSHGKPIVTTKGHLSEPMWNQTDAVELAPVGDVETFVRCVRRLSSDRAERQLLGSAARRLYRERFDISRAVAALRQADTGKDHACTS